MTRAGAGEITGVCGAGSTGTSSVGGRTAGGTTPRTVPPDSAGPGAGAVMDGVGDAARLWAAGITGEPGTTTVGNDVAGPPDWGGAAAGGGPAAVGWCTSGLPKWMAPVRAATAAAVASRPIPAAEPTAMGATRIRVTVAALTPPRTLTSRSTAAAASMAATDTRMAS